MVSSLVSVWLYGYMAMTYKNTELRLSVWLYPEHNIQAPKFTAPGFGMTMT